MKAPLYILLEHHCCFPPGGIYLNLDFGNRDTKVCDWIGCFPPGDNSLNKDLGNCDNCKGICSRQTSTQKATLLI